MAANKKLTAFDDVPEHVTNLLIGAPAATVLSKCAEIMTTATKHRMEQPDAYQLFQYGPEVGDRRYREAVVKFLTEEYRMPVDVEDVIATAGATQGLHVISHLLFSPGDLVFVENPTYFIATKIFKTDAGLKLVGVPLDAEGIISDELEKAIQARQDYRPRELTERKPYWGMIYLLASFHNPCGMCLAPDRGKKVIELARKYNLLIVSDDVYNLTSRDTAPARLFSFDKKTDPDYSGNAVSNGSFSKIFGPGLRLGWMEAPAKVRDIVLSSGLCTSGGGFNHTVSGIMTSVIEMGLMKKLLEEIRPVYKAQCQAMCSALREEIPAMEFTEPAGGFFVWAKLPQGVDGKKLLELCRSEKYNLAFCPGESTSVTGDFKDHIRLAFCHYDRDQLRDAVTRLSQAIKFTLNHQQQ